MQDPALLGRTILAVEDEPIIVMDIAQIFAPTGAEMTTTDTLRHALLLVEHDVLDGPGTHHPSWSHPVAYGKSRVLLALSAASLAKVIDQCSFRQSQ
jgi:hypothetical protein